MKIRNGFVTNSSSTNFLIISKEELSSAYLAEKLGFNRNSILYNFGLELSNAILSATKKGIRHYDFPDLADNDKVREIFGEKAALIHKELLEKGYFVYAGHTRTDDGGKVFETIFTLDSFEVEENDIYINGKNCVY